MTGDKIKNKIEVYTDGSCIENPGIGGWGVFFPKGIDGAGAEECFSGSDPDTTNNRMELMAAIRALEKVPPATALTVFTDSEYLSKSMTQWLEGWKRRGWRKATGEEVANPDLWQQLDALNSVREVNWEWLRAHVGIRGNERADTLANDAAHALRRRLERNR